MGRSPCCDDQSGLKKGPWTTEEDQMLVDYISKNGHGSWRALPKLAGLNRCGKSCRLRWINYLRPDIKRGKFSEDEERVIINLRKKLLQMGLDPNTHRPRTDLNHLLNLSQLLSMTSVRDMVTTNPWDNALRLQAGAAQLAKMQLLQNLYMKAMNSSLANPGIDNKTSIGNFGYQNTNFNSVGDMEQEWNVDSLPGEHIDMSNISMTIEGFEGLNSNLNNLSNCYDLKKQDQELVTSSPGSSITNNRMEVTTSASDIPDACQSSPNSIFENWEKFMDDDTSESYWKNILQSIS